MDTCRVEIRERVQDFLDHIKREPPYRLPAPRSCWAAWPRACRSRFRTTSSCNRVLHEHVLVRRGDHDRNALRDGRGSSGRAPISEGLERAEVRYGFMEQPNVPDALALARARARSRISTLVRRSTTPATRRSFRQAGAVVCRDGARRCSRSCTTMLNGPAPISRFPAPRSWRSASNSRFDPPPAKGRLVSIAPPCKVRTADKTESTSPAPMRRNAHGENGREADRRAVFALSAAAGGSSQDVLLDLARLARRSGLDLFSRWRRTCGPRTPARPSRRRSTTATSPRSRKRSAPPSPPRPTRSSPPAPIRAAWSMSSRRRAPPASRSINFNTPDPKVNFNAYVGGDLLVVGKGWAQYLVDHKLVKSGDFVWMPVEVPGASYGVEEEKAIDDRLQAAQHHLGSHRQRRSIRRKSSPA